MCSGCFFEVCVDLLDEDRLGLRYKLALVDWSQVHGSRHTWILAVQRVVMVLILDPETPGGLRLSIDCRIASSSATADDMMCYLCLQDACQSVVRSASQSSNS